MIDYQALRIALNLGGLLPDEVVPGRLERCRVSGDKSGKKSGAYRLFDDELPTCAWWNWKTGESGVWVSNDRPLTPDEYSRQKQRIEQARRERQASQEAQWRRNKDYLLDLWSGAQPLAKGTPVNLYLERRGLLVPSTEALRYAPSLLYWDGENSQNCPAMLGAVTSPEGALVALHRTYLTHDGFKAPLPIVKKLTRTAGSMSGASIKIGEPIKRDDGRIGLGVAEGIETAMAAAMLSGLPVWSCVSANGLAAFTPPAGVHHLYVFADNDQSGTGQQAASVLAKRLCRLGLSVRVLIPGSTGDWADELLKIPGCADGK